MLVENGAQVVHPGEVLAAEFLEPLGLSQNRLALDIRVPAHRISQIVRGKRRVSPDSALRLALYFHTSAEFGWGCRWRMTWRWHGLSWMRNCGGILRIVRRRCGCRWDEEVESEQWTVNSLGF